jgi:hypothetical protein
VISEILSGFGLALILVAVAVVDRNTPFPGHWALLPTIGAALIILWATPRTVVGRLLSSQFLVGLGLISYSAYLWHYPLFAFARHSSATSPKALFLVALSIYSLGLAFISWRFVEQPFRKKGLIDRRRVVLIFSICTLAVVAFGQIGNATNGFQFRFDSFEQAIGVRSGEALTYVTKRADQLLRKPFDSADPRKRILIIGDSYGQDLLNAIFETELVAQFQVSIYYISANCGNLHLPEDFTAHLAEKDRVPCKAHGWYRNEELLPLIQQSDMIWLASSWMLWQAKLLSQSVRNIEHDFNKPVLVFGRKNFGTVNYRRILLEPVDSRLNISNELEPTHVETNAFMRKNIKEGQFIDVSELFCGIDTLRCRLFTPDGHMISYDGGHLSVEGAKYLGKQLLQHVLFKR